MLFRSAHEDVLEETTLESAVEQRRPLRRGQPHQAGQTQVRGQDVGRPSAEALLENVAQPWIEPGQTFLLVGSLVLVLVVTGGWYLLSSWDSLFPNSESVQGRPAPQRIDPIARAKKLHEQGKTAIAMELIKRFPMEIVSVDSAMVYRHMDIGTAKPDADELAIAPHHLIDGVEGLLDRAADVDALAGGEEIGRAHV